MDKLKMNLISIGCSIYVYKLYSIVYTIYSHIDYNCNIVLTLLLLLNTLVLDVSIVKKIVSVYNFTYR